MLVSCFSQYVTVWSNVNGEHQTVSWDEHNYSLTAIYAGDYTGNTTCSILFSVVTASQSGW